MKQHPEYGMVSQDTDHLLATQCNDTIDRDTANLRLQPNSFLGQVVDALMKGLARGLTI